MRIQFAASSRPEIRHRNSQCGNVWTLRLSTSPPTETLCGMAPGKWSRYLPHAQILASLTTLHCQTTRESISLSVGRTGGHAVSSWCVSRFEVGPGAQDGGVNAVLIFIACSQRPPRRGSAYHQLAGGTSIGMSVILSGCSCHNSNPVPVHYANIDPSVHTSSARNYSTNHSERSSARKSERAATLTLSLVIVGKSGVVKR